jgi:hypothetical protein
MAASYHPDLYRDRWVGIVLAYINQRRTDAILLLGKQSGKSIKETDLCLASTKASIEAPKEVPTSTLKERPVMPFRQSAIP